MSLANLGINEAASPRPWRHAITPDTSRVVDANEHTVFHLDANRAEMDMYNIGWKPYLLQRETDERRRKRERLNAEKKASTEGGRSDRF